MLELILIFNFSWFFISQTTNRMLNIRLQQYVSMATEERPDYVTKRFIQKNPIASGQEHGDCFKLDEETAKKETRVIRETSPCE